MKTLISVWMIAILALFGGCGYKEGVVVKEEATYIYFTGDAKGAEVEIDGGSSFVLEKAGPQEHYKMAPGKHTVIVRKNGQIVVKRELLLGDGMAREISVP